MYSYFLNDHLKIYLTFCDISLRNGMLPMNWFSSKYVMCFRKQKVIRKITQICNVKFRRTLKTEKKS